MKTTLYVQLSCKHLSFYLGVIITSIIYNITYNTSVVNCYCYYRAP